MKVIYLIDRLMESLYKALGWSVTYPESISLVITVIALLITALVLIKAANTVFMQIVLRVVKRTSYTWDDHLLESGFFNRFTRIIPAIVLYLLLPLFLPHDGAAADFINRCIIAYMAGMSAYILAAFLDGMNLIYQDYDSETARRKPIKAYLQVIIIFIYIIGGVLVITIIANASPVGLLSGIGAMSAVLMLIFKDSIMGFVSSMQLSANDMVRIGDWIEMPKYGADGDVIDITLQSIVVQNWDKTITTIPIYSLVADSFKNWRGMQEAGGRRIKQSISIDMRSVHFLCEQEIDKLSKLRLLSGYMPGKLKEIAEHNRNLGVPDEDRVSGRHLTNLGTYRAYVSAYLAEHSMVNKQMTHMVRYLPSTPQGLPLEIYLYSADTRWVFFEGIQADIIDHLLAVMPEFGLRVFQNPSGNELEMIARGLSGRKSADQPTGRT